MYRLVQMFEKNVQFGHKYEIIVALGYKSFIAGLKQHSSVSRSSAVSQTAENGPCLDNVSAAYCNICPGEKLYNLVSGINVRSCSEFVTIAYCRIHEL